MPVTGQKIVMWARDSFSIAIGLKNQDGTVPNLTGASARWAVAAGPFASAEPIIAKSTASGSGISLVQIAGAWTMQITLDPADTAALKASPPSAYYYEAEVTETSGRRSTVATGPFELKPTLLPA